MQLDAEQLVNMLAEKIGPLDAGTAVIGIHTGGVWVAERLAAQLNATMVGKVAVTLHRDDFASRGLHPQKRSTGIGIDIDGRHVLLVDDVLQSGRTVRAAVNELFDFGRPASEARGVGRSRRQAATRPSRLRGDDDAPARRTASRALAGRRKASI